MKIRNLILCGTALMLALSLHAEKIVSGPQGGRLLEAETLRAEFFVNTTRLVEVLFYDSEMKPMTPSRQVVTVTAEAPNGKVKLEMESASNGFVSKTPLPEGEPCRVVVQIKATAESKPKNFRVDLNLGNCGGCSRAEYACTCESH